MGIQRIFLPDYASEASQVFDADVAGISVSVPFNETVGLTAFWARPFNDNWTDDGTSYAPDNYLDNVDIFGLVLPLTFDGLRLTLGPCWVWWGTMPFARETIITEADTARA